jgi:hypothetical protein
LSRAFAILTVASFSHSVAKLHIEIGKALLKALNFALSAD